MTYIHPKDVHEELVKSAQLSKAAVDAHPHPLDTHLPDDLPSAVTQTVEQSHPLTQFLSHRV